MSWHHSLKTSPNSFDSVSFMVLVTQNRKTLKHGALYVASREGRFGRTREGRGAGDTTHVFFGNLRVVSPVTTIAQSESTGRLTANGSRLDCFPNSVTGLHELAEFRIGELGGRVSESLRATLEFAGGRCAAACGDPLHELSVFGAAFVLREHGIDSPSFMAEPTGQSDARSDAHFVHSVRRCQGWVAVHDSDAMHDQRQPSGVAFQL